MSKKDYKVNPEAWVEYMKSIQPLVQKEYEMHADGVKEVREECPFCKPSFCDEPHCPYTEEE